MKKLMFFLVMAVLILGFCNTKSQAKDNVIKAYILMTAETILTGGNSYGLDPKGIDLTSQKPDGFFTLYIVFTGSGTALLEMEMSFTDQATASFFEPAGISDIAATVAAGTYAYPLDLAGHLPKYIRIQVTEDGADSIVITSMILTVQ